MTGAEPDPQFVALSRTVERTARRVGELDKLLRQLAAEVTVLAGARATTGPDAAGADAPDGEMPVVRAWLLAEDPDTAYADLAELVAWLHRVYLRYHDAELSSCWLWHPDVVEELWWLRCAHADAYDPRRRSSRAVRCGPAARSSSRPAAALKTWPGATCSSSVVACR